MQTHHYPVHYTVVSLVKQHSTSRHGLDVRDDSDADRQQRNELIVVSLKFDHNAYWISMIDA